MDIKRKINELRNQGMIHGKRPGIVKVFRSIGGIYSGGTRYFVLTSKGEKLLFQGLSKFFANPCEKFQFSLNIEDISRVEIIHQKIYDSITIYTKEKKFLPFLFFTNVKGAYDSKNNIRYQLALLKENGVKVSGEIE